MSDLVETLARVQAIQEETAGGITPGSSLLLCEECGNRRIISKVDVTKFLKSGWPTCCGNLMHWVGKSTLNR